MFNLLPYLIFFVSSIIILIAGVKLTYYGDHIATVTKLGGMWIGVVLLAVATSLPEVLTDMSAAILGLPDLAVGDLFGSNLVNMLILGIIDLAHRQKRIWQSVATDHALIASLAIILTALSALFISIRLETNFLSVGLDSFILICVYILGIRIVYRQENLKRIEQKTKEVVESVTETSTTDEKHPDLKSALKGFALSSLAILIVAPFLASSAKDIAELTGLSTSVIGTLLVAISTSLPELVTSFTAIRIGAFDLAVGNLFGSNAFNMAIFFFTDLAYRPGSLFVHIGTSHLPIAIWSIIMMAIALIGILYRAEKRFLLFEPDSLLLIICYVVGVWLLF